MILPESNPTRFWALFVLAVTLDIAHSWVPHHRQAVFTRKVAWFPPPPQSRYPSPSILLLESFSVSPEIPKPKFEGSDDVDHGDSTLAKEKPPPNATHIQIIKHRDAFNGDVKEAQHQHDRHYEIVIHSQRKFCPFVGYLFGMKGNIKNRKLAANRIDDELKRMESRYYGLAGDDLPQIRYPYAMDGYAYKGRVVQPTEQMYELVCAAYYRSGLGKMGAQLAEDAIARYEKFNRGMHVSSKTMGFAMKTWIAVQDMERAEYWLRRIENKFEMSHERQDIPGTAIYNHFVIGLLADTKRSRGRKAADLSMAILEEMNIVYQVTKENFARPGHAIYSAAIKCQPKGYRGIEALVRMEDLYRELQKAYFATNHYKMKPTAETALPLLLEASRCYGPDGIKAVKMAEGILSELLQLYKDTGDLDYRPPALMYECMFSMYMRVNRQQRPDEYAEKIDSLIESLKETKVQFESKIVMGALNRRLQAADNLIPKNPLGDPVGTRNSFGMVLETFKMFHGENAVASPNASTYEIFLRACNRLPMGESRSKLAAKAFTLCRTNGLVTHEVCRQTYLSNPGWVLPDLNTTEEVIVQNAFIVPDIWNRKCS